MSKFTPSAITADKNSRTVTLEWNDGHVSVYPFMLLRAGCPCAVCRGGHEKMRQEPDAVVFDIVLPDSPATRLEKAYGVGSYALGLEWADGHHEGIFGWDYLRALCPCKICRM